jgi:YidC/Oxa1 family membrane protein insertase
MDFQRLLLFVIFSMSGLFLFQAWQKENNPQPPAAQVAKQEQKKSDIPAPASATGSAAVPSAATSTSAPSGAVPATSAPTTAVTPAGEVFTVETDLATYRINTLGGVIEEVALTKHRDGSDKSKPYLTMMKGGDRLHIAQTGLIGNGLPNHNTAYTKVSSNTKMGSSDTLEIRLSAPIASGGKSDLVYAFKRGSYIVDVTHEITNGGSESIQPTAYFHLHRDSKVTGGSNAMIGIFTGPAVFTEKEKYKKVDFKDLEKNAKLLKDNPQATPKSLHAAEATDGWAAMVEHYFVNAWLPKPGDKREYYSKKEDGDAYRVGVKFAVVSIAPGGTAKATVPLFAGPQEQELLKAAAPELDIVVDYGIFSFAAKPMFWLLSWFHGLVANWGWAIVLLTILIKAAFYPLNAAAGRSMGKMKLFAPKMKELQERYAGDRAKLNQAMMELYKKEKINPMGGCLPILVQIPVFIALYWVLIAAVELRHAPWVLWVKDLSAPDPWFILPLVYMATAFAQAKLQPPAPGMDPIQQKVLMYMPVAFGIMFFFFPAGLVLYWTVSNILQIAQQWQINKMLEKEQAAQQALLKR